MEEKELPPIHITADDVSEANRLSLHCPICAGAVENNVREGALFYGRNRDPALVITYADLPKASPNGASPISQQTKRLKAEQAREVERMRQPGFWQRFWQWLLDQIRIG
jgi:hypothetical protein